MLLAKASSSPALPIELECVIVKSLPFLGHVAVNPKVHVCGMACQYKVCSDIFRCRSAEANMLV
jgi:hypothetical protein